jgi:hypothetical protein
MKVPDVLTAAGIWGRFASPYWIVSVALRVVERYVPEMIDDVPWTALVVTVKVVLLEPAGIVTEDGTCAAEVLLLFSVIAAPVGGAAPLSVSVPVELEPPVTVLGFRVREVRDATVTVREVLLVVLPNVPEIETETEDATPLVVIVKVALVDPPGINALAGTCATDVLLLCKVTTIPPGGATPFKVTVPVEGLPPTTELGLLEIDDRFGGLTVRVVVLVSP